MTSQDFNQTDRAASLKALSDQCFDLLVIGGGITGAGVARDAAMRGLSVALIEAQDLASGTSSRSSKMIHGGLRYLVAGDVAVVKESASERATLHRIAPHLAQKTPYVIPTSTVRSKLILEQRCGPMSVWVVWSERIITRSGPKRNSLKMSR